MNFLYTLRAAYDSGYDEDGYSWYQYKKWSGLNHLTELVSLDALLNELLVEPDYNNEADWDNIHVVDFCVTGFYTTQAYVLQKAKLDGKFNLLTAVIEPDEVCETIEIADYEFVGYDLLDPHFIISALTNCGGFDDTFLPEDLNQYGLIDDYLRAYDIKKRLFENHPYGKHTNTHVIALWRHKTIGR
jgi:hypothetical protein